MNTIYFSFLAVCIPQQVPIPPALSPLQMVQVRPVQATPSPLPVKVWPVPLTRSALQTLPVHLILFPTLMLVHPHLILAKVPLHYMHLTADIYGVVLRSAEITLIRLFIVGICVWTSKLTRYITSIPML